MKNGTLPLWMLLYEPFQYFAFSDIIGKNWAFALTILMLIVNFISDNVRRLNYVILAQMEEDMR